MESHSFRIGSRVTLDIESVAFGARGVGRVEGMVVFVPGTVDGDRVEADIVRVRRKYLEAELVEVLTPSPFRVEPLCRHYQSCGGCHYQHLSYDHELTLKERQVRDTFERIGKLANPPVRSTIPSPDRYRYRQKAEFHAAPDAVGRPVIGFMGVDGKTLVHIDRCEILDESINAEYGRVKADPSLLGRIPGRKVFWSHLPFGSSGDIRRQVGNRSMIVPARGFFQANALLVEQLAEFVADACPETGEGALLDCCCGSGLFALFAARDNQPVIGIDVNAESLRCAKENLHGRGVADAVFHRGSLEKVLRQLPELTPHHIATAILDPPRTGSTAEAVDRLAALGAQRIVYVSCNPATQARDVRLLLDRGYRLITLQPFDMFPRTRHVEVVAVLSKG